MSLKKFLQDYETVTTTDERGREKRSLVYRGDYFDINLEPQALKRFKLITLALTLTIIGLHIGAGFVGNAGMYMFYVAMPYVVAFFPLIYLIAGALRLPWEKRSYKRDEVNLSFDRMRTSAITLLVFLVISMLGEGVFLVFVSKGIVPTKELLFLAIEILSAAPTIIIILLERKVKVQTSTSPHVNPN